MTTNWEQWEGRTVDGKYLLGNYLGGSEGRAVFLVRTERAAPAAAVKLIAAEDAEAEAQLRRWEAARELSHPNLIGILTVGRTVVDGRRLIYAVEEFAEENLAQIVPERALTLEEARGVLEAVLAALEYVHGKGLVHGGIRPANILAAGDQVKLSSDGLRKAGEIPRSASTYDAPEVAAHGISQSSDVWSLGITLVEVMTQHVPALDVARMSTAGAGEGIPEPIREIVRRCLDIDPRKRCGLREIRDRLELREAVGDEAGFGEKAYSVHSVTERRSAARWVYGILVVAVIAAAVLALRAHRSSAPVTPEVSGVVPKASQPVASESTPERPSAAVAKNPEEAKPTARGFGEAKAGYKEAKREQAPRNDVVERVMPEVSANARRTIEGRVKVHLRVDVDAEGNVTEARLTNPGPSKYFARVALEGARRWKFAPAQDQSEKREWSLLFVFTRARTEATAAREN